VLGDDGDRVPDDHWGESVRAVLAEEHIISFCEENLAGYQKPRWVEFGNELPKNPTGKIPKRMIRD